MNCIVVLAIIHALECLSSVGDLGIQSDMEADTIRNNTACPVPWGGTLDSNGSYAYDGCTYVSSNATSQLDVSNVSSLTLTKCGFSDIDHRIIYYNSARTQFSTMSFAQCIFEYIRNADTTGSGGCMYLSCGPNTHMATCSITSCTFRGCASSSIGGALHIVYILPIITDSHFYSCKALNGGAIYLDLPYSTTFVNATTARIDGNEFVYNTASNFGGSLALIEASGLSFAGNSFCGGSSGAGGSDLLFIGEYTRDNYALSCSDSSGCKVWDRNPSNCATDIKELVEILSACATKEDQC